MPSPPVDVAAILGGVDLFADLPSATIDAIAGLARMRQAPAGSLLFSAGDAGDWMACVISGKIKITLSGGDGREMILNVMGPGHVLGEIALLDGRPRTADAQVIEDCWMLVLDRSRLLPLIRHEPDIAIAMIAVLCQRIRRTSAQIEAITLQDIESRLARLLLQLAEDFGRQTVEGIQVETRLSQTDLGSLTNNSRQSINRLLRAWASQGLVTFTRSAFTVHDAEALAAIAGGEAE